MTKLSPSTQAVLDAASDHWPGGSNHPSKRACIATALRAAAEQVVPAEPDVDPLKACNVYHWNLMNVMKDQRNETRHRLLAIAAELGGKVMADFPFEVTPGGGRVFGLSWQNQKYPCTPGIIG